ncbi:MAG: Undecaprenyl-diphosphatase [Betaproteobacteria bacterium]|nr:Undecaprenyl-diphosphatase [Betaproteobacteria bacterium]
MDTLLLLKAALLGIVEGLTEFLPVSSTGHLILAGQLVGFTGDKAKLFEIVIQGAAILAVVWEYRARFIGALTGLGRQRLANRFALNLTIAFIPLAVLGLLFNKAIKAHLFNAYTVAFAFIIGGIIILVVERNPRRPRVMEVDDMRPLDALKLGLAQCFGLFPGMSRSGSTIIGGMLFGLSRKTATEFSFFLAVPTLVAATLYSLYKERHLLAAADWGLWLVGAATAFVSAFICVRWLIRYISGHDFKPFAWYRIAFGLVVLASALFGWVDWSDAA